MNLVSTTNDNSLTAAEIAKAIGLSAQMPSEQPHPVTVAKLSRALGSTSQSIHKALIGVPSRTVIVGNRPVKAWLPHALPAAMQEQLAQIAQRQGYRNADHLLADPPASASCQNQFAQAAPGNQQTACKDMEAFTGTLRRLDDLTLAPAEIERLGLAEFQKAHGYAITPRHFRRRLKEILQRDNGARNWENLNLYLPNRKSGATKPSLDRGPIFAVVRRILAELLPQLENKLEPTADDRSFIWHRAFEAFDQLAANHPGKPASRLIKNAILDWLHSAVPGLSKTPKALRRVFEIKLKMWRIGGQCEDAIRDLRPLESGNFRTVDFSADLQKIRDLAILHNGNESIAHRKLRAEGQLSAEFVKHYRFDRRRNKSYVAHSVRQAITPEVEMCGPIHRGPWQAKMAGPYIPRDWSGVFPAQWFSGDDFTLNHYWYYRDEQGRLHIERGECLILHDLRTGYILDYILIAGKYNSRHIRNLILKAHDRHGLPHVGFYFERGVWKALAIQDLDSRSNCPWRETERGLSSFGLQLRHATTPRAKIIEGIGRILQETQRPDLGFVGFDERRQNMERQQDFIARARAGKVDPAEKLYSMEQWGERLDAVMTAFNADPQNGKLLQGQSPLEAWQAGLQRQPLRKLPDNARYHLSTHCRQIKVGQHGIKLHIGQDEMLFCNEETGRLIGRQVLAFFNYDCPDLLTVTDMRRQNPFTVKSISVPGMAGTKEQFAPVHVAIQGHRRAAKVIYDNIKHPFAATITRDATTAPADAEITRITKAGEETLKREQTAAKRQLKKIRDTAAVAGIAVPASVRNLDRVQEGLELEKQIRAELQQRQQEEKLEP